MSTEADTCREYVLPKLQAAGWDSDPHSFNEQKTITDGKIIITKYGDRKVKRKIQKRVDYLLKYRGSKYVAVVEAKADYKLPGDGLQQAKKYAEMLDLKFSYSTNGHGIIEFDCTTGKETELDKFPTPDELWTRLQPTLGFKDQNQILSFLASPYHLNDKSYRYYQDVAIDRALNSILNGNKRVLLTMATGTGKTFVAFQICWKLWSSRWNCRSENRHPKILYLSDRNILIDDPKDKMFTPFGDARWKIENGIANKGHEMYFAIYQSIAQDEKRMGLYKEYSPDFFDLIIIDECHRGSARDESNWREILEYFRPAYQLGMTATPLREDNRDTYAYFGNPIYQYSLKQGIQDGFLAPYRVHRVVTNLDAHGWRPEKGQIDRFGREIPDREYHTDDFERNVAMKKRTETIAKHLTRFLRKSNPYDKTIVFCVDQEHADEMRRQLNNLNSDLVRKDSDYVVRITADELEVGRGYLSKFQDLEEDTPVIATTSKLLTTGVDIPTCKNIAIACVIGSMTEFKQIIGRGTRVRDDYGKYFFNIIDYTGSATRHFADPEFDGFPDLIDEQLIDDDGIPLESVGEEAPDEDGEEIFEGPPEVIEGPERDLHKYYFDGGRVEIIAHVVYELDEDGHRLRAVRLTDYTADKVRTLFPNSSDMRKIWADPQKRSDFVNELEERGIDFDELRRATGQLDADPFDLLCNIAFSAPIRTRRERADHVLKERGDFLKKFAPEARDILENLLEKYAKYGVTQFKIPEALKVPPISEYGNVGEIAELFGGVEPMKQAIGDLQNLIYAE